MTYSVELFICMIIGLVMGHAIFNTGDYSHIKYFIANFYFDRSRSGGECGSLLCLSGSHT